MKKQSQKPKVEMLLKESYLSAIKNSVGTKMFREYFAKINGKKKEVLDKGDKSCAVYVSSVLLLFGLVKNVQLTVHRTLKEMQKNGWIEIKRPKVGSVLLWEEKEYGKNNPRKHIGFYIGKEKAISNSSKKGSPSIHSYKQHDGRKLEKVFWHPKLDK
jgi:hypothetical protein